MDQHIDEIIGLIDGGLQRCVNGRPPVKQGCVREGCHRQPDDGHALCPPCLAWVTCETDVDPLPPQSPPAANTEGPYDWDDECWAGFYGYYGID